MGSELKFYATGRRKTATAKVTLVPGTGNIVINGKTPDDYFCRAILTMMIKQPLQITHMLSKYDVFAKVVGGGVAGQAGAIRHGISRALEIADEKLRPSLKHAGFMTRDPRMKERKKYGRKKARKRFQFSKR